MRRRPVWIVAFIGLGLVLAPVIFQMFTRAPKGGQMIAEFEPFMSEEKLDRFDAFLVQIDEAHPETDQAPRYLAKRGDDEAFARRFPQLATFNREWPGIFEDMSGMLATIKANLDNFAAVNALPPFPLFPWFFVLPGLILWFTGRSSLKSARYTYPRKRLWFLAVMGAGLIAAPAIFQMFTRAPLGAEMIEDFGPIMTEPRIRTVQGHFLSIAGAEGDIRVRLAPSVEAAGGDFESDFPRSAAFVADWQVISAEMAPMVGAMADNLDNFAAVKALPPFWLFPWFFVLPGALVAGLALGAMRRQPRQRAPVKTSERVQERGGVA